MSQSDNFDTDIDIDQEPAPAQEDQDQEQSQEEQLPEEQEPRKPKGGLLVKGIIALAVVGGIGFYFLKPSGVQTPTDTSMPVAQMEPQPAAMAIAPPPAAALPEAVPEQPKQEAAAPAAPPAPTAIAANEDPLAWGGPVSKAPTAPAMMPPPASSPAPAMPAAAETAQQPAAVTPEAAAPVAEKAAAEQAAPKVSEASQEKVDTLEKRLAALEETITSLQAKMLTRADIESLAATVGKMQQEQDAEKAKAEAEEKTKAEAEAAKAQAKEKVKAKAKPAAPKVKKAKSAPVPFKAQAAAASAPAPNWVLKSAKPGMAWVAEKGSAELNTISVGGTLPGIGKITAIEKDSSGRWVVSGTEGKISQ
jgi:hypothetical protein